MRAAILYCWFLDYNGIELKIGGIETYLLNMASVCREMLIEPIIYQFSNRPFERDVAGITVKGVTVMHLPPKKRPAALFRAVLKEIDNVNDIVIFGTDAQSVKSNLKHVISIQHGIAWDLKNRFMTSHKILHNGFIGNIYKAVLRRKYVRTFIRCPFRVCVDYNFLNWFNTYSASDSCGMSWVIPNFGNIASKEQIDARDNCQKTKIIFARRFCEYRGTRLMAEAAKRILVNHTNVEFSFAGEGPDERWLKEFFNNENRVSFIKYHPVESLHVHLEHHIAVIPSLASEGTSLAVAEAMGSGCAVIATAIGGITNMIFDGYNGLLISPNVSELTGALFRLIENPGFMKQLGENAYKVASQSFSVDKWRTSWCKVLDSVMHA
jgi:glycosyltransferase involved in cell wall biosynthesis